MTKKRNAYMREWNKKNHYASVTKYRNNNRKKLRLLIGWVKMKGCSACGYKPKNPASIDFHHINPNNKLFTIGEAINMSIGVRKLQEEMMKCILICSNCHRENHWIGVNDK